MPLHDVKCLKCDHIQEAFWLPTQKPNIILCEKCKSKETEVLLGSPRIDMGGSLVEKQLERDASDGIF
jgi:Zn finger protein HypA/HybF involved in hydrogenase expression